MRLKAHLACTHLGMPAASTVPGRAPGASGVSPGGLAHPRGGWRAGLPAPGALQQVAPPSPALACGERRPTLTCSDTGAPLS